MPEDSRAVWKDTLRRVLSPSVGKALTEYAFPNEQYVQGGTQQMLYQLLQTKLEAEEPIDVFLTHLSEKIQYASAFAFTCAYCTYTIRSKDKTMNTTKLPMRNTAFCLPDSVRLIRGMTVLYTANLTMRW